MSTKRSFIFVAWCLGLLSTFAQVTVIRELLIAFTGNELTIASTLAFWLVAVAIGCFLLKRGTRYPGSPTVAGSILIIAGIALPVQVLLVRLLRPLAVGFGEIPGPGVIAVLSLLGVAPCAIALGALFVALVGLLRRSAAGAPISIVYGVEALGSASAGLLLSLYLLEHLNPVAVAMVAAAVGVGCGVLMLGAARRRRVTRIIWIGMGLAVCLVIGLGLARRLDLATRRMEWSPFTVVTTVDSKHGNIMVVERDEGFDFFESGLLAYTVPDPLYAEESVHIPLLLHPDPRQVLLVGAAGAGTIKEIGKHPSVARIDFVELDPKAIGVVDRFAPAGWLEADGKTVNPIFGDGRRYVARTQTRYDMIIVSVGMPVSLQINRYYTSEFFDQARRILEKDGIVALKIPSAGAYLSRELGSLVSTLTNTCKLAFGNVKVLPGDYLHVIASPGLDLEARTDMMLETLSVRGIETSYINRFRLWDRLSQARVTHLDSLIAMYDTHTINTDAEPLCFSYAMAQWAKHFRSGGVISGIISWLSVRSCLLLLVVTGFGIAIMAMYANRVPLTYLPPALSIYSMGFTTMFVEVLIVLAFQVTSGYVYSRIAAIVAAFMFGMGIAASASGARRRQQVSVRTVLVLQVGMLVMPLAVAAVFGYLRTAGAADLLPWADTIFIILAGLTGCLGGLLFSAASSWLGADRQDHIEAGALSYSLDLVGAAVAGFATGFLIIPALGLVNSAYAVSIYNAVVVLPLVFSLKVSSRALPH
jgi:spermidine synthase